MCFSRDHGALVGRFSLRGTGGVVDFPGAPSCGAVQPGGFCLPSLLMVRGPIGQGIQAGGGAGRGANPYGRGSYVRSIASAAPLTLQGSNC